MIDLNEYLVKCATDEYSPDPLVPDNMKQKRMLLMKYGVIPAQLTPEELAEAEEYDSALRA